MSGRRNSQEAENRVPKAISDFPRLPPSNVESQKYQQLASYTQTVSSNSLKLEQINLKAFNFENEISNCSNGPY